MKVFAIIAVVLICLIVLGLQHIANWMFREDDEPKLVLGFLIEVISIIILLVTIYNATIIF